MDFFFDKYPDVEYTDHMLDGAGARRLRHHMSMVGRSCPGAGGRGGGQEELPHIRGKEQQLCFAGAAVKRPHVQVKRNPSKTLGTERGDQRADRLETTITDN